MKKALIYTFLFVVFAFSSLNVLNAQPHPGQQNGGGGVTGQRIGDSPSAPIGGGAEILITLGIAYAISKYKGSKKEE